MVARRKQSSLQRGMCHCTALRKASRRITQMYDAALAPSELKITQRSILGQLRRSGPTSVSVLADTLVMDAGGLAHTLKPLERDGLIKIEVDPADRRGRIVSLARVGLVKLNESDALWNAAQLAFEKALGHTEAISLLELMDQLISGSFIETFQASLTRRLGEGKRPMLKSSGSDS